MRISGKVVAALCCYISGLLAGTVSSAAAWDCIDYSIGPEREYVFEIVGVAPPELVGQLGAPTMLYAQVPPWTNDLPPYRVYASDCDEDPACVDLWLEPAP